MPLQKTKFFVFTHHSLFQWQSKTRCPIVSHPTPFSILIIVELVVVLNMHEIFATLSNQQSINQKSNSRQCAFNFSIDWCMALNIFSKHSRQIKVVYTETAKGYVASRLSHHTLRSTPQSLSAGM